MINGLSAVAHPCQALADMLTINERFATLTGLEIAYISDARKKAAPSVAGAAIVVEVSVDFGCSPTLCPPEAFFADLQDLGTPTGATARAFSSAHRAARDADVLYTDIWTAMGEEHLSERDAATLLPNRVTGELIAAAAKHANFRHCRPAHRDDEVAPDVIDGPQTAVVDRAKNRLHAQKALLVTLLTDLRGMPV